MGCILLLSLEQQVVNRERASRACELPAYHITSAWHSLSIGCPAQAAFFAPSVALLPPCLPSLVSYSDHLTHADRIGPYYLARLITAAPLRIIQGLLFSGIM